MGLFDDVFGGGQGAAAGDMGQGYANANNYLNPYYQGGTNDWNQYHQWMQQQGNMLNGQGNPMQWAWSHANMSPTDFYNGIMNGYKMSPQAQYAMNQMTNATDHAASASGMLGSGAYGKALNQNANQISQNDMQQYYDNAMRAYQGQMMAGQNFQNQQNNWVNGMRWGAGMGYGAGNQMGQNAIGQGMAQGYGDEADASGVNNMIGAGIDLAGMFL